MGANSTPNSYELKNVHKFMYYPKQFKAIPHAICHLKEM